MHQVGRRRDPRVRKGPTSSRWRTARIKLPPAKRLRRIRPQVALVSCSDADVLGCQTGKDGRKHASGSETSECLGNKIRDSQDPGGICGMRPRILRLERLVGRQQCGGFGRGQSSELPSPHRMEKGVSELLETTAPCGSLERSGRGNVQDRWYAGGCAHPGHVRSLSPTRRNAVTQTIEFPGTDGGWRPMVSDTGYSLRPVPREAKLEMRTTRSVSTQNDVCEWGQSSRGFSDDNHRTGPCST